MADAVDLYELAQSLLDTCVSALDLLPLVERDGEPVGLYGAPALQFVAPGVLELLPVDCEFVAVIGAGGSDQLTSPLNPLPAADRRPVYGRVNLETLSVLVTRCMAVNDQPTTPAVMSAIGLQTLADRRQIAEAIYWETRRGILQDRCDFFRNDGSRAWGPEGNYVASVVTVRFQLDGYDPFPAESV